MPCLYVVSGPDEGSFFNLTGDGLVTMGRGDDATIQLVDERSSRVHCELTPRNLTAGDFGIAVKRWILNDKSSSNGTRVGAERIYGEVVLEDGDLISLGRTGVVFLNDNCPDADTAAARCEVRWASTRARCRMPPGRWRIPRPVAP